MEEEFTFMEKPLGTNKKYPKQFNTMNVLRIFFNCYNMLFPERRLKSTHPIYFFFTAATFTFILLSSIFLIQKIYKRMERAGPAKSTMGSV